MKIRKPLATKASLNEILLGVLTDAYDFDEVRQLRIVSATKPGFTVLCVEADVSADVAFFLSADNQSPDVSKTQQDIPFESTVYDFVVVGTHPDENGVKTCMVTALHELLLMNSVVERGAGDDDFGSLSKNDWSMEAQEWDMFELVDKASLIALEDERPTDMKQFG
jgi:hypothetical protein